MEQSRSKQLNEGGNMARARMYGWAPRRFKNEVSAKRISELKGQAAVIRDVLDAMERDSVGFATDIAARVEQGGKLVTRQDVLRVTLYYLLVFKKRGWVIAQEQPADDGPEIEEDEETEETEEDEETEEEIEAE